MVTPPDWLDSTVTLALGTTPASLRRVIKSMSPCTCSVNWRTTTATGGPAGNSVNRTRLPSSAPNPSPMPRSMSPGIGLPNGDVVAHDVLPPACLGVHFFPRQADDID